jgi:ligand-binding sensor domain-containing protein
MKYFSFVILSLFTTLTIAQNAEWLTYNNATTSTQLCNPYVQSIFEDNQGNMWFGTYQGISIYDGQDWTTINSLDGLVNNFVNDFAQDDNNNMWMATNKGVSMYDGTNWTNYNVIDGLVDEHVNCIEIDNSGNIWFGTDRGVSKFDGTNWTNYTRSNTLNFSSGEVYSILIDGDKVWISGNGGGLCVLENGSWTKYTTYDGLVGNNLTAVVKDKEGNIWISDDGSGISKFNGVFFENFTTSDGLPNNAINGLKVDNEGTVWCITDGSACKYANGYWEIINSKFPRYALSIYIDRTGNKWFGENGGGATKFDGTNWTNYPHSNTLNLTYGTYCILIENDNKVLVGGQGAIYTLENDEWSKVEITGNIESMVKDTNGAIWAGSNAYNNFGGLYKFHNGDTTLFNTDDGLVDNYVTALAFDNSGKMWIGTKEGLSIYNGSSFTNKTETTGLAGNLVQDIYVNNDSVWVATSNGVSLYYDGNWTTYTSSNGLIHSDVKEIEVAPDNSVWFATSGRGLSILKGNSWSHLTWHDGLPTNTNNSLYINEEGVVYINKGGGIVRYEDEFIEEVSVNNGFGSYLARTYDIVEDNQGRKWLATNDGVYVFSDPLPPADGDTLYASTANIKLTQKAVVSVDTCLVDYSNNITEFKIKSYFIKAGDYMVNWEITQRGSIHNLTTRIEASKIKEGDNLIYLNLSCSNESISNTIVVSHNFELPIGNENFIFIPDTSFKNKLLSYGFDINNDGEIDYEEAALVHSLSIYDYKIHDLTGIDAFVNISSLSLGYNSVSELTLTTNKKLEFLSIHQMDQFVNLDISNMTQLTELSFEGNGFVENICVWELPWPQTLELYFLDTTLVNIHNDCKLLTNYAKAENNENKFKLYPNPAQNNILITSPFKNKILNILISDINGKVVSKENNLSGELLKIYVEHLEAGLYNVTLFNEANGDFVIEKLLIQK